MDFYFKNKELEKLYEKGKSNKYRLPDFIIEKFFARIQQLESAVTVFDLSNNKGLNFEKLTNTEIYSVRLNKQYRLEFEIMWINPENTIAEFAITELSNHYK